MSDEGCLLVHAVKAARLSYFRGVDIPTLSPQEKIDFLIGQTDRVLLAVLLGPIASDGRVGSYSDFASARRTQVTNDFT